MFALSNSLQAVAQSKSRNNGSRPVVTDPAREAQKRHLDSLKAARQHVSDSLAARRKYRESKHYKDSVAHVRQARIDSIQASRKKYFDSLKASRQRVLDSTIAARKAITDLVKARQKKRSDSLAAIRKYRESKRYRDSTALARQNRLDSIRAVRKTYNDSIAGARKAYNDSVAGIRKAQMDSITAVRTHYLDSVKAKRQARTDSLAKVHERRKKTQEAKVKEREQKQQLAFELKLKKKREAWSNEKMLKKKWSFPRSSLQNTFTHYNYYFNTDKKMDEALENMQRARKENFDSTLGLFPFDPDRDSALLASDMDSIIQKASVGIQIHDPRTKWGDDLYLLLGQAYYYKGDYENSATSFRYIVYLSEQNKKKNRNSSARSARAKPAPRAKTGTAPAQRTAPSIVQAENKSILDFLKHQSVHNEALLWLARTYTEAHQEGNAESVIDLLETDPNLPQSLKGRVAVEKAYVALSEADYKLASEQLEIVAADKGLPDWLRQRAAYLNGQLYQERGNYAAASQSFEKVIDLKPKIDMDFYARKNLAYSTMMSGGDQESAVASLKRVLNDGKYTPYYEQVYYVMGRLAANTGKTDDAIAYLRKGISAPKSTKKQKALSYAVLGGVYYDLHDYVASKNAYDSAMAMAGGVNDSLLLVAAKRSASLGEISGPVNTIHMQDSLLALAALSDKEQYAAVRKYIRHLENLRNDSAYRAENQALNTALQNEANNATGNNGGTNYTNWYFSNAVLMQQGVNEFKRKWGSRPNVDNWRRLASISLASNKAGDDAGRQETDNENDLVLDENGLPTEESLLALIPNSQDRKEAATKKVQRAYVDLGTAYIKLLEDYPQAIHSLDTLDKRFPAHEYKAEVLYLRYLVALKQNRLSEAQGYAAQLQNQYGDSKWAKLVRPTEDGQGLANMNGTTVANFYDETYGLLLQRQYSEALQRVHQGQRMYTDTGYLKKFQIVEAIASVGVNDFDRADTLVTAFLGKYPTDSLRRWAEMVMRYIKKNRVNAPPPLAATVPVKMPVAGEAPKKDTANAVSPGDMAAIVTPPPGSIAEKAPAEYEYKPQSEHYAIFVFKALEQRAMGVKAAISDFNTFKFGNLKLDSKVEMAANDLGIIVTRTFQNAGQARIYLNTLKGTSQVFREYTSGEYKLLLISATNYLKLQQDKAIGPYLDFYKKHYQ